MVLFADIASRLASCSEVYRRLTHAQLLGYFDVASRFVPLIALGARRQREEVQPLPDNVALVISLHTSLSLDDVFDIWRALADIILSATPGELVAAVASADTTLSKLGPESKLGAQIMLTSVTQCLTEGCELRDRKLGQRDHKLYSGWLYTRRRGVLPVQICSLYCRGCHTTYRPNYFVRNASDEDAKREYYEGVPDVIEVAKHTYVEKDLMVLFRAQMALAHASAETVAKIYNLGLSDDVSQRGITAENVWDAFYLHALLEDKARHGLRLRVPHGGTHEQRFLAALSERNDLMVGTGQPLWAHACDDCEHIFEPPADAENQTWTRLNACVMDGVTIGHPRCNARRCVVPLTSPRDRFCPVHSGLKDECAIDGCANRVSQGCRTCSVPNHRHFETSMREKSRAIFHLKRRLHTQAAAALAHGEPVVQDEDPLDDAETLRDLEDQETAETSRGDNIDAFLDRPDVADVLGSDPRLHHSQARQKKKRGSKTKTTLTRKWTHNEQLLVRPCGIVMCRATFFEAESPSNALRFLLCAFAPDLYPNAKPSFVFYDNNCKLLAHIRASGETRLDDVGMPVDVFHASTKHSDRDEFCQQNCNPAGFPELYDENDEWVFNSSVCEQVNSWFGRFLAVVREMSEVHFNFFLDEMVAIHNSYKEALLEKRGKKPRLVPLEELRLPRF